MNRTDSKKEMKEALRDFALAILALGAILVGTSILAKSAHKADCPVEKHKSSTCSYFWCGHYNGGENHVL